jgi:hypothetical protein
LGLTNNTEYTFKIRTTYIPDNSETMISAWSNEVKVTPNYCIIFDLQCQVEADHYSKTNNILQYNFSSEDITGGEIIENSLFVFEDILFKDITDEIIQPIDDTIIDQSFNLILKPDVNTTKSINSFVVHIGEDSVRFKKLDITLTKKENITVTGSSVTDVLNVLSNNVDTRYFSNTYILYGLTTKKQLSTFPNIQGLSAYTLSKSNEITNLENNFIQFTIFKLYYYNPSPNTKILYLICKNNTGRWQMKNPIIANLYEQNISSITYSYPPRDGGTEHMSTGLCSLSGIELFKLLGEKTIRSFSNNKSIPYLKMYNINKQYLGDVKLFNSGWYISLDYDSIVEQNINEGVIIDGIEVYFERLPNQSYPIIKK